MPIPISILMHWHISLADTLKGARHHLTFIPLYGHSCFSFRCHRNNIALNIAQQCMKVVNNILGQDPHLPCKECALKANKMPVVPYCEYTVSGRRITTGKEMSITFRSQLT